MSESRNLIGGFLRSAETFAERPALDVDNRVYGYAELAGLAGGIAAAVRLHDPSGHSLAAVLAHQSIAAYAGILGVLVAGKGYVPLHPHHPVERTARVLSLSGCDTLIVGQEALRSLEALLPAADRDLTVLLPFVDDPGGLRQRFGRHRFIAADALAGGMARPEDPGSAPADIAYVIFTSGSTGVPKGVPVSNANVVSYVRTVRRLFNPSEQDRFSQLSDLTFDLSIHPVWVCWASGGCLCAVPDSSRMAPAKFIQDKRLTVWTSVPSAVMILGRMRLLKPAAFPSIRYSMFCGEPLPVASAARWQEACPHSVVDNYYGPTEATCAITSYRWDSRSSPAQCANGLVPIGWPFAGQRTAIVDDGLAPLAAGRIGELCLAGDQVTAGYLDDPDKTREKYVVIPELGGETWYRTGDLAHEGPDGCLYFHGRADNQVKVLGYRVELQEIEHAVRQAAGTDMAVCVAWPVIDGSAEGTVAFVAGASRQADEAGVLARCRNALPDYMVPKRVHFLSALPLNPNGKFDRGKLTALLSEGKLA